MQKIDDPHCDCGTKRTGFVPLDPTRRGPNIGNVPTNNSWWVCSKCGLPTLQALNDCEDCGRKFQGIRPGIKFAYPCPDCE